jgi:hypothetical protein
VYYQQQSFQIAAATSMAMAVTIKNFTRSSVIAASAAWAHEPVAAWEPGACAAHVLVARAVRTGLAVHR